MSNLTSTLTIALNDDGLAAKAKADAEALKKLGATEADLKRLGKSGADALARVSAATAKAGQLDTFKAGARNLKELGREMRQARGEAGTTAKALGQARAAAGAKVWQLDGVKAGRERMAALGVASRGARKELGKAAAEIEKRRKSLDYFNSVRDRDPRRYARWEADGLISGVQAKLRQAEQAFGAAEGRVLATRQRFAEALQDYRGVRTKAKASPEFQNTKEVRAAERAHRDALKRQEATAGAWREQAVSHRALRRELVAGGVEHGARGPNGGHTLAIGRAEAALKGDIEAANGALREQIALLDRVAKAEGKAAAKAHHVAEAMASADGSRQAAASRARANASANRRMIDGMGQPAPAPAPAAPRGRPRRGNEDPEAAEGHKRDHYVRHHGVVGTAAGAAAGYASAHGVMGGIEHALKAGAEYQHEAVALRNAGRTRAELKEIDEASRATTRAVPTAGYAENLKVINETTGAFGSLEHAKEHLTFMQKAAAVVKNAAGDKVQDDAGEMGNKMARFAEERGTAGDGHVFEHEAEKLVRAMVFTRGNFNASEALNFAQQAKSSLQGYNERFLTGIMPSIVSTMGGDRAGTAANSFNGVIDGKVNDKKQAEEWLRLGLLDKDQAIMKGGHAVGWRTGAIKDTAGAHADPLKWMEDVVLPALKTKGGRDGKGIDVDDAEALKQALATMFRNQNANFFANELSQLKMRGRLHKDEHLMSKVDSLQGMHDRNLKQDPWQAAGALKTSIESLTSALTSPSMVAAASGMSGAARLINDFANVAKEHPVSATMGGAAVAGGALAGAGYLSYQLINGFGLGTSATALTASAASLEAAAVTMKGGAALGSGGAAATAGGAAAAGGTAALVGVISVAVGTAVGAAFAIETARKQMPKEMEKRGPGAFDPATGGLNEANPMEGLGPKTPVVTEWFQKRWPGMFGNAKGSLPPGKAYLEADPYAAPGAAGTLAPNAPAPLPQKRLPGLDGRPGGFLNKNAPPVQPPPRPPEFAGKTYQPGFGETAPNVDGIKAATAALAEYRRELETVRNAAASQEVFSPGTGGEFTGKIEALKGKIAEAEAKLKALSTDTVAPQVDTSRLDAVKPAADGAKAAVEGLNVSVAPQVDTGSISAAQAAAQGLLSILQQIGSTAGALPGKVAAASAAAGSLKGRSGSSKSFSDGVTPGAGAE